MAAIRVGIYNNSNAVTKSFDIDIVKNILASEYKSNVSSTSEEYYFKISPINTAVKDTGGATVITEVNLSLSDLALNSSVQSASNTSSNYTNISTMVADYLYDITNGHAANKYLSGCVVKAPIDFT